MRQVLRSSKLMAVILLGMIAVAVPGAFGQQAAQPQDAEQRRAQNFMSMWNPQVMIDQSVRQAVRRYNLTPEQEQIARKMTTEGVNEFLDKHESELRGLIREALQARFSGNTPSSQQVQEWAQRAAPLLAEGKKAILEGNQQFRDVLTEEQKKVFDADQKVIQQQFTYSDTVVNRWMEGKFNPETDLPRGGWFGDSPRRRPATSRPTQTGQDQLDRWDLYVRGFINRYNLDAPQTSQAMGILADSKRRATEYWFSRKADIDAANERIQDLLADPSRSDQVPGARKYLDDLNRPVETLYVEMQERLNKIPTDEQRKAFEAEAQARRDRWRDRIRRSGGETAVSATSQSRPAASQITEASPGSTQPATASRSPATGPVRQFRPTATRPARSAAPAASSAPVARSPR